MPRIPQGPAIRGSQKWFQKLVLPNTDAITWHSPLAEDEYAEYQDQAFLHLLGITLSKVSLSDFWPLRGPLWDGLVNLKPGKYSLPISSQGFFR